MPGIDDYKSTDYESRILEDMTLLALLPSLLAGHLAAQQVERSSVTPASVSLPLRRLEEATGWIKAGDEWSSADRKIGGSGSEGPSSLGLHEFRSLEWRTVEHGGKKLPVLIITQTSGAYVYPTIRRDWFTMPKATVLIFEKFPFIEPLKYELGKTSTVEVDSIRWTGYDGLSLDGEHPGPIAEKEVREIIGKSIARAAEPDFKHRFKMVVFPVEHEGKKKVRFLFEAYNVKDRNSVYEKTKRQLSPESYLNVTPKTLNSLYYETSFEAFRDFFAPLPE